MLKQAVFLVGGLGTRLKDLTRATPKPLVSVGGRPFIDYLIDEAARHGFTDILLLAGHLGAQFEAQYHGRKRWGSTVRVIREPEPMGTGGAVRFALSELDEFFLLANGDSFFDVNLRALPFPNRNEITMVLRESAPGARYGTVRIDQERVRGFHTPASGIPGPINTGIYLMSREVVAGFVAGPSSIEGDYFPLLAEQGRVRYALFDRFFIDMGVPEDLARAQVEMPLHTKRPAVFFDRDGVLNVDHGYVHRPEQFEWLPGAREAIRVCNDRGYFTFVVTNQAGVAHGHYEEADVVRLHAWMTADLATMGAHIDAFEYCPYHPDGKVARYRKVCARRKPGPGMIQDLLANWPVDTTRSFLIGDKPSDIAAANGSGIEAYLYTSGNLLEIVSEKLG